MLCFTIRSTRFKMNYLNSPLSEFGTRVRGRNGGQADVT